MSYSQTDVSPGVPGVGAPTGPTARAVVTGFVRGVTAWSTLCREVGVFEDCVRETGVVSPWTRQLLADLESVVDPSPGALPKVSLPSWLSDLAPVVLALLEDDDGSLADLAGQVEVAILQLEDGGWPT